ncbi:hypothetical protein Tsubulata_008757 [Turnera subulata]|uniref:Protein TIFY n=1 Tax=Turnera subulata TaxID=218843 RepID=A0A9Q0JM30_9ROSI|nr:hypothetical protein Tsubulata_008757 [Turnera subulata]
MSRAATVELDFFAMDKDSSSSSSTTSSSAKSRMNKLFPRQRSFRDIQSAISKINPELLKSVIASASANQTTPEGGNLQAFPKNSYSLPSTPKEDPAPLFPAFPVFSPLPRAAIENPTLDTAPLTIFYNGKVVVFDVARDKAETILKLAEKGISKISTESSSDPIVGVASADEQQLLETDLNGDLPMARRKSLQKFLEKRKERHGQ